MELFALGLGSTRSRCILLSLGLIAHILPSLAFRFVGTAVPSVARCKFRMKLELESKDDRKEELYNELIEAPSGKSKLWGAVAIGLGGVVAGVLATLGALFVPLILEDSVIGHGEPLQVRDQSLKKVGAVGASELDDHKAVQLFEQIISQLRDSYVDPVDTGALFETAVNSMYVLYIDRN